MADRARDYQPGERVPGTVYQVVRLIGAGGMGTVYDVEDTTIGKRYVLKTLHPQLGSREDLARRMQNEARTLAKLQHPNIVEVITAGVTGDDLRLPYYVMERLEGQSLRLVLEKRGQLELQHAYHVAIDLLDALDHAHDKGVIHRDVKPDNIFLHRTSNGITITKLLDFGIMSLLDSGSSETAGRFLGTLRYAAPEQLRGEKPTPKVDVYAAALVLYETVAGRGPFDDEGDPHKVAAAHIHKVAPLLSHWVIVPPELDSLLNAALSKIPEQRPRDAFSFAASLRNLKKALPGGAGKDSTENRATAAALGGAESGAAPFVRVGPPTPQGHVIIRPAPPEPSPPSTQPAAAPRTTMRGMPPLSAAGGAAPPSQAPTATSAPSVVDREAPTHSLVAGPALGAPSGPAPVAPPPAPLATPAAFAPTLPSDAPPPVSVHPIQWPAERPIARSEDAHVRTLSGQQGAPARSAAPLVAAVLLLVALASVSGVLVAFRLRGAGIRAHESPAATAASEPLPAPPGTTTAAPTEAPTVPATASGEPAAAAPSSEPAPAMASARPAATAAPAARPLPKASPGVATASRTAAPALPGPGF